MISKPADINPFQTSSCVRSDIELLPDWEASLPHGRLWTLVRGGAGVLGAGQQPGRAEKFCLPQYINIDRWSPAAG